MLNTSKSVVAAGWAVALGMCAAAMLAAGEDGVYEDRIVLGQSAALSGPAAMLGLQVQRGMNACIKQVNDAGGVRGRKIELMSLDDSYDPQRCKQTTQQLINEHRVFLLIGYVGTPTAQEAVPLAERARVPFIAPFTGAAFLREPFRRYVINIRAGYNQETERLAQHLVGLQGKKRIACFYQDDGFGLAGLSGITAALERRKLKLAATGTVERNTIAIADGLNEVLGSNPDAVVIVGPYRPCAAFIKAAQSHATRPDITYCAVSVVGTNDLAAELGSTGNGVIVSQVLPLPWDTSVPIVKEYQRDMTAQGGAVTWDFGSMEGYLAARLTLHALSKIDGEPTREKLLDYIYSTQTFELGGITLQFGPNDNQGSDAVLLSEIRGGRIDLLKEAQPPAKAPVAPELKP